MKKKKKKLMFPMLCNKCGKEPEKEKKNGDEPQKAKLKQMQPLNLSDPFAMKVGIFSELAHWIMLQSDRHHEN